MRDADALYTDASDFIQLSGWSRVELIPRASFKRSRVIYAKHARCTLYQIAPIPEE